MPKYNPAQGGVDCHVTSIIMVLACYGSCTAACSDLSGYINAIWKQYTQSGCAMQVAGMIVLVFGVGGALGIIGGGAFGQWLYNRCVCTTEGINGHHGLDLMALLWQHLCLRLLSSPAWHLVIPGKEDHEKMIPFPVILGKCKCEILHALCTVSRRKEYLPLLMGATTLLGIPPLLFLVNADLQRCALCCMRLPC
jgi:hypothetical protein